MNSSPYERSEYFRLCAIVGDFVWLNVCLFGVFVLLQCFHPIVLNSVYLRTYVLVANLCYVPAISLFGVVLHRRVVRPEQIVGRVMAMMLFFMICLVSVLALMKHVPISRMYLLGFFLSFGALVTGWRLMLRKQVKAFRSRGRNTKHVVLVGDGDNIRELKQLMEDRTYGYQVAKVFDSNSAHEVITWLSLHPVHELFCSLSSEESQKVVPELIHYCENHLIRFYQVPYMRNYVKRQLQLQLLGEVPVLSIHREPLQDPTNRFIKRAFDLMVSTIFLCTVFPILYIVVGLAIKITSPGPIFFKQARNGENGDIFYCYKFRSMKVNKDSDKVQATENDPRKTKLGNFLRKSNLDEMPQFINVFKGEMSLVGPRPHMLRHTEEYSALINKYMMRHLIKPGITGWAQVTGFRGETKELSQMEGRVKRDLWYVENWTFLLDLRIMAMTVTNMFRGEKNAY